MGLISYAIRNMRVVPISEKLREKYPERLATVHGEFHAVDAKGKVNPEAMSFGSKVIEVSDRNDPGFAIDPDAGTLTVPAGERGRKAAVGLTTDEVTALLFGSATEAATEAASN